MSRAVHSAIVARDAPLSSLGVRIATPEARPVARDARLRCRAPAAEGPLRPLEVPHSTAATTGQSLRGRPNAPRRATPTPALPHAPRPPRPTRPGRSSKAEEARGRRLDPLERLAAPRGARNPPSDVRRGASGFYFPPLFFDARCHFSDFREIKMAAALSTRKTLTIRCHFSELDDLLTRHPLWITECTSIFFFFSNYFQNAF